MPGRVPDPPRRIAYYVSGHGFGHATRSAAIISEMLHRDHDVEVHLVTDAPMRLFECTNTHVNPARLVRRCNGSSDRVDVGLVQRDGIDLDFEASERVLADFLASLDHRAAEEAAWLTSLRASLVVLDVPPLAALAAERAGIPSVAVGNFTWDWIYESLCRSTFAEAIARFRAAYRTVSRALRLPFSPAAVDMPFDVVEDVPLVVRLPERTREDVRRRLGLAGEQRPISLLTFGGFGLANFDLGRLAEHTDLAYLVFGDPSGACPDNVTLVPADKFHHPDLIQAADCVVAKPGYGTVSEVLAVGRPFLAVRRENFRECGILLDALKRHVPCDEISAQLARCAEFDSVIRRLLEDSGPSVPFGRVDGARVVADRLLELEKK